MKCTKVSVICDIRDNKIKEKNKIKIYSSPKDITTMGDIFLSIKYLSDQGKLDKMEDNYSFKENILFENSEQSIYCVFDGHGGDFVSSYLRDHFIDKYIEIFNNLFDIEY